VGGCVYLPKDGDGLYWPTYIDVNSLNLELSQPVLLINVKYTEPKEEIKEESKKVAEDKPTVVDEEAQSDLFGAMFIEDDAFVEAININDPNIHPMNRKHGEELSLTTTPQILKIIHLFLQDPKTNDEIIQSFEIINEKTLKQAEILESKIIIFT
jgi:hypothetical protein